MYQTDNIILIIYFVVIICISLFVSRRARKSADSFFLGGKQLPWYILGISGMASFVDLSGTAFQVAFFFLLGAKGFWVGFQGNLCLMLAFLMIFMGKWLNRSGVMTNAELISLRFGKGRDGKLARIVTVVSILVIVVAFLGYFFVGSVKTLPDYIPFFSNPKVTALFFFGIVAFITMLSGFQGVVFTDLLQSLLILGLIIYIGVVAFNTMSLEYVENYASIEWTKFFPSDGIWMQSLPDAYSSMNPLGILLIFWLISNVLQGFALPFDAWTSQRYYAARNERESALIAWQWISLYSLRFVLMASLGILAVSIAGQINDPELALSQVIVNLIPIGIKGVLIAAIIAAALSTINSFVNSSASYFVNDIYHPYIKPDASQKQLVRVSLVTTGVLLAIGAFIGWFFESISMIWGWITMGLLTGTLPPNILKWFWSRLNGIGYVSGVAGGVIAAFITQIFFPDEPVYVIFIFVFVLSTISTIVGNFFGKQTDEDDLKEFYTRIRPAGFWGPVKKLVAPELVQEAEKENRRDMLLLIPAVLWQISLFYMWTAIMFKQYVDVVVCVVIIVITSVILYKYWYKNLRKV